MSSIRLYWAFVFICTMKVLVFLVSLLIAVSANAQQFKFSKILPNSLAADFIIDESNNLYLVQNGILVKLDSSGTKLATFAPQSRAFIESIYLLTGLKISCYTPSNNQLVLLTRNFAETELNVEFNELGYVTIKSITPSFNNGFWLYDSNKNAIIKLNENGTVAQQTADLSLLLGKNFEALQQIIEVNNTLYVITPTSGVYELDVFGNYKKNLPIKINSTCTQYGGSLVYCTNNAVLLFSPKAFNMTKIADTNNGKKAILKNGVLYVLTNNGIEVHYKTN